MILDWTVVDRERSANTARSRLIWVLAKGRTEAKTRRITARDIGVMAIDRLRDPSVTPITASGTAWRSIGELTHVR